MFTVTALFNGKRYSFSTKYIGTYIHIQNQTINPPDKIYGVSITKDMVITIREDRDFRSGAKSTPMFKDERRINNIDAYDWNGNHLWNIGDIVGDLKTAFFNGAVISKEEVLELNFPNFTSDYDDSHDLYICNTLIDQFLIDLSDLHIIGKRCGRW